jgi:uncharacterized protein (DUF302 family)
VRNQAPQADMSAIVHPDNGIVSVHSTHSFDVTVERLKDSLEEKPIKLIALIDPRSEAEQAGLQLRPTTLVIFGNPRAGTPLMNAAPSVAIDLPLKLLVWEDATGGVWISFNSPDYLLARNRLPQELPQNIAVAQALATKAAA